jgi:hypothetical protein
LGALLAVGGDANGYSMSKKLAELVEQGQSKTCIAAQFDFHAGERVLMSLDALRRLPGFSRPILGVGMICIPLPANLPPDDLQHILQSTKLLRFAFYKPDLLQSIHRSSRGFWS